VAGRDALARELSAAGDAGTAARVRALRRPTVATWLLNRLAVDAPAELDRLLSAGERLRQGQARALHGEPGALREAGQDLQLALAALLERAEGLAAAAGHGGGAALRLRVERALRAAASGDASLRDPLRAGALEREPEPAGIDLLAGLAALPAPPPERARRPSPRPPPPRGGAARRAEERGAPARTERSPPSADERRRADAAVAAAVRELEDAERRLSEARATLAEARRARDRLR
jgi:hypothetical protein